MDAPPVQVTASHGTVPGLVVKPLTPVIGAEIDGIDLREPLAAATAQAIRQAWYDHTILLVRNQSLSEDDQARFAECFGALGKVLGTRPGFGKHPAVMLISNIREDGKPIGRLPDGEMYFHSDQCYTQTPPIGTMLYSIEVPSQGGNTLFANMYTAYEALPEALRQRLDSLRALNIYDLAGSATTLNTPIPPDAPSCVHPMIRTHPMTGRKSLYVNRLMTRKILDLPDEESSTLLTRLFDHQEQRRFIYEHVWRQGDVILWDNRCTLHARTDFSPQERRLLKRITVRHETTH